MSLFYCYLLALLVSAIAAVLKAKDLHPAVLRRFAWFLPATALVELAGLGLRKMGYTNHWLYNLYLPVHFFFYSWLYYRLLLSSLMRRIITWSSGVFAAVYLLNLGVGPGLYAFNSYPYLVSSFLLVGWVLAYFQQLLRAGESISLVREPVFWISTGLLFFHLGHFLYLGLINYLLAVSLGWARRFMTISSLVNILTYSLFLVAFLCPTPRPSPTPLRSPS